MSLPLPCHLGLHVFLLSQIITFLFWVNSKLFSSCPLVFTCMKMMTHSQAETQICLSSAFPFFPGTFVINRSINRRYSISIINVCISIINIYTVSAIATVSIVFFLHRCLKRFVRQVSKSWVYRLQLEIRFRIWMLYVANRMESCTNRKITGGTHPPEIIPPQKLAPALLSILLKLVP